jgi:hypothetical protein
MQQKAKLEAVRMAKEALGERPADELSAYIQDTFGMKIDTTIVKVLLGTLLEREVLDRAACLLRQEIEKWKLENPEEAKVMDASIKRKQAAKRRKAKAEGAQVIPSQEVPVAVDSDIIPVVDGVVLPDVANPTAGMEAPPRSVRLCPRCDES